MNELDIIAMIKQSALKLSADEIIAEYKEKGFVGICPKVATAHCNPKKTTCIKPQ